MPDSHKRMKLGLGFHVVEGDREAPRGYMFVQDQTTLKAKGSESQLGSLVPEPML